MPTLDTINQRIDAVISRNARTEILFCVLAVTLFGCGICCVITAVAMQQFAWSVPSVFTTAFLHYPLKQIRAMRKENIALAAAPMLIDQLPADKAAEEIQKLLQSLHGPAK